MIAASRLAELCLRTRLLVQPSEPAAALSPLSKALQGLLKSLKDVLRYLEEVREGQASRGALVFEGVLQRALWQLH